MIIDISVDFIDLSKERKADSRGVLRKETTEKKREQNEAENEAKS